MTKPLVSVIVPAYNAEDTIEKCLDSIVSQDYLNIQLIIVDDGSSDSTAARCNDYVASKPLNRYIFIKNSGPSVARNRGIDVAEGEYIMFVDSDDCLLPGAVSTVVAKAQRFDADLVSFNFIVSNGFDKLNRQLAVRGLYPSEDCTDGYGCLKYIYSGNGIGNFSWAFLYHSSLFFNHNFRFPEDIRLLEDAVFLNGLLRKVKLVAYESKVLYEYVIRGGRSITSTADSDVSADGLIAIRRICSMSDSDGTFKLFMPHAFELLFFVNHLACLSGDDKGEFVHDEIMSEIKIIANRHGVRANSVKDYFKVFLVRHNLFDLLVKFRNIIKGVVR